MLINVTLAGHKISKRTSKEVQITGDESVMPA
jgi:hypothetical protein